MNFKAWLRLRFLLPVVMIAVSLPLLIVGRRQERQFHVQLMPAAEREAKDLPRDTASFELLKTPLPSTAEKWCIGFNLPGMLLGFVPISLVGLLAQLLRHDLPVKGNFWTGLCLWAPFITLQWFWIGRQLETLLRDARIVPTRLNSPLGLGLFSFSAPLSLLAASADHHGNSWFGYACLGWSLYGLVLCVLRERQDRRDKAVPNECGQPLVYPAHSDVKEDSRP